MIQAPSILYSRSRLRAIGIVVVLLSGMSVQAHAQYTTATGTPTFTTALPVEMGFTNVSNGNLHIEIRLGSFPQRGSLGYNARLVYDSLIWKIVGTTWQPTNVPNSMGGWRLITGGETGTVSYLTHSNPCDTPPPIQYRTAYTSFTWTAPDGTSHRFPIYTLRDRTVCNEGITSDTAFADDSSGYYMSVTNYTSATVYAPDGTEVYPIVTDTNGNYFSKDASGNTIDTLQRTPITVTSNGSSTTYAMLNPQGTRTNISITTGTVSANTSFGQSGVTECNTNCTVTAIQSIAFDDGTNYSFTYDSGTSSGHFAELTGMKLRTGANVSYGYTTFADGLGNRSRWLSSKAVGSNTWRFTPQAQGQTAQQVTVSEPTGDSIIYSFSLNNGAWRTGATYVDATRGTLVYLTNTWDTSISCPQDSGCSGSAYIRKLTDKMQFPGGLAKTVTYYYTSTQTGQVSEIDESDYSTGTPPILRKTLFSYASLSHTVSKPVQVTVKNASNNTVSQTNYTYDESQYLTATSGIVQHGSPPSSRGNATTVSRWVSGSTYLTAHTNFYDTGVPYKTIDPNTSATQYTYMCQAAYPSSFAAPLGLTTTLNWDCNTGLLNTATDPNNQVTSYHYDSEGRATEIDYPDGGQNKNAYNLSANPPNIVATTKMDSSQNVVTTALLDGLGRGYQTQVNSDPAGTDHVDTVYDQLGRVQSVSNSYRTTGDPTYGITSYTYDVLGRTIQITQPDNQTVLYSYTARATSIQDEGNGSNRVQKVYQTDGLGRLTSVCEVTNAALIGLNPTPAACGQDIAATGFLTSYQYNALDNLTRVVQAGLNDRVMAYDGLSRLVSEAVPEASNSTATYVFNTNGDLYQRIRPTVNQTNPAVTTSTTYSYDPLHRLTQTQYSDGTPGASYYYDETSVWGANLQNSKGRLTHSYRAVGSTCAANILSYDPMGRVLSEWQQAPYSCGGSIDQLSYQYDLAGNVKTFTNGRGVTFTQNYDASSSFSSMTSSYADAQHPSTLISSLQYNALGETTAGTLGNAVGLNRNYNKGGWLTSATDGNVWSVSNLTYAPNGNVASANDSQNGNWSYTYDDFNRLKTAAQTGQGFSYVYDRYGNRWQQNLTAGGGPAPQYTFDANNHITTSGVSYDAAGNVVNDGLHSYNYDAENRLVAVDSGGTASYLYDAGGRRAQSATASGTQDFLFDLRGKPITVIRASDGTWLRGEVWSPIGYLATYVNSTTYFNHADWLGTVRKRSNVSGAAVEGYISLPFGDALSSVGLSPVHYTGDERDAENNLDHFLFRQYSSTQGRWMSPDPAGLAAFDPADPQSLNRYAYVLNSPCGFYDQFGLDICTLNIRVT